MADESAAASPSRRWAHALGGAGLAICLWGLVIPVPYNVVIPTLIALPWVGALAINRLRARCRPNASDIAALSAITVVPGIVLAVRTTRDLSLVDVFHPVMAAIVLAVVLAVINGLVDPKVRRSWQNAVMVVVCALPYSFGTVVLGNAILEDSPAQTFQVSVLGKWKQGRVIEWPHLTLSPWGPRAKNNDVDVLLSLYVDTAVGDVVCVHFRSGPVRIRWFVVTKC